MKAWTIFGLAILLLTGLCACQKHNDAHPLYVRAKKLLLENDFQTAAQCFSQYLEIYPQSAEAHKALGTIYDDRLKAPVLAIYHYRKFLEYAPADHPDRPMVTRWIAAIEQKYYQQLKNRYNDPEDLKSTRVRYEMASDELGKLKTDYEQCHAKLAECVDRIKQDAYFIAKLKQQNAILMKETAAARQTADDQTQRSEALTRNLDEIKKINAILHQDLARFHDANVRLKEAAVITLRELDRTRAAIPPGPWKGLDPDDLNDQPLVAWLRTYEDDPASPAALAAGLKRTPLPQVSPLPATSEPPPAAAVSAPVRTPSVRTYTVKSGDTLSGISKKFYGTSRQMQKILDTNKKILTSPAGLRSGQTLEIPQ